MPFAAREVLDPRITISRTNATGGRFNSAGMYETVAANYPRFDYDPRTVSSRNLLTYSEFQNGLPSVRGGSIVVGDMTTFPGFDTGVGFNGDNAYAYKQFTFQPNTTYTFSTFVRMSDGTAPIITSSSSSTANDFALVINGSLGGTPVIENFGYGVYRVSSTYTTPATVGLGNVGIVRYTGQSARNFLVTGYQLNKGTTPGTYIPTLESMAGDAMARGILVEAYANNYILQSENQTISPWSGTAAPALIKTLDNSGPGGLAATTYLADGTADSIWGITSLTAAATSITASCYMKKVGTDTSNKRLMVHNRTTATYYTGDWNPSTGAIVGTGWTSEQFEDGWWLCTLVLTSGITVGDGLSFYHGMVGANKALHNYKVAAPQLENGKVRTSYIVTGSATSVRGADLLTVPASTLKYKQSEGTLFFEGLHAMVGVVEARIGIQIGDTLADRHFLYANNTQYGYVVVNNSGSQKAQGTATPGGRMKGVLCWDTTGYWVSINGADAEFTAFAATANAETKLWIGSYQGGAAWDGVICGVEYYPKKLTTTQMKTMSTL